MCIDVAFAVNKDMSSERGLLLMLRNEAKGDGSIVHYTSVESKRVCKSALAAELFTFVDEFDVRYPIAHTLQEMHGRKIDLIMYTDSRSLYGLCIPLAHTTESRLQIYHSITRKAYERREISKIL